jgi:transposase
MRKASDKTKNILAYVAEHPKAKAKQIAEHFGVTTGYVYNLVHKAKKTYEGTKAPLKPFTQITPERMKELVYQHTRPKQRMQGADIVTTHHTDMVDSPAHYKVGGMEVIDFIEAKGLGYNLGNVVKYIARADHKGNKYEDLCKARWYLNRAIASVSNNT